MKMRKILAIVLIINFIFFSISNIVFAINTENNVIDTELEEKDINDKNINKDVEKQEDTDSDEENDQELNAENNKQDSDDEFIQDTEEKLNNENDTNTEIDDKEQDKVQKKDKIEVIEEKDAIETNTGNIPAMISTQQIINPGTQTIKDGTYIISSALKSSMVLDVSGGSIANGANVQIWEESNVTQQRFKITYLNNGYYKFEIVKSRKVLDVAGAGKNIGTNVQQYESNNSDAQQWIIKDAGNGYYNIISKCNGLYLDVANASTNNGTNVQLYSGNNTNAQKFVFEEIENIVPTKTINDGIYEIVTAINSSMVLDIDGGSISNGANVQIYRKNNTNAQKFYIKYLNNGYYKIETINSAKVLDVAGAGRTSGTNIQQYESNNSDAQQWVIKDLGNGYYNIISKCNELYVDIAGGSGRNGTNVQLYKGNKSNAQKFKLIKTTGTPTIKEGTYEIATALNSKTVLDIAGGSTANGANVQVWDSSNVLQQKFKIEYKENGYYSIKVSKSGKVLDVAGAGKTNGTNVQQYENNNTEAQDWVIKDAGDGYYHIISRCSGLHLDIENASITNGTNVQLYVGNNTKAQKFKFKEGYMGIDVSSYQASINWSAVKEAGVDFAMLRIGGRYYGSGGIYEDTCFAKNVIGTRQNNIDIGVYFYSQAVTKEEARAEANFVINTLRKYNVKVTYPVVIDTERTPNGTGRADILSAKDRTDICIEFLETVKRAGYKPMIYSNKDWLIYNLEISRLSNYDTWLAHYTAQTDYKNSYTMWQYTSSGSVPGIAGNVDMDICYNKYF